MARYHAFQLTYEEVTVLDIPMIFTEARIDRSPPSDHGKERPHERSQFELYSVFLSDLNDPARLFARRIVPESEHHIRRPFKEANISFPAHPALTMLQTNELLFHLSSAARADLIQGLSCSALIACVDPPIASMLHIQSSTEKRGLPVDSGSPRCMNRWEDGCKGYSAARISASTSAGMVNCTMPEDIGATSPSSKLMTTSF